MALALFLVSDVVVHKGSAMWGWYAFPRGLAEACDRLDEVWVGIQLGRSPSPLPWLGVTTALGLSGTLARRWLTGPTATVRLTGFSAAMALAATCAVIGTLSPMGIEPGIGLVAWATAIVLMCAALWTRHVQHLARLRAWQARPTRPGGCLGSLAHLAEPIATVVRQTRRVRCALDTPHEVNPDALRVLAEWQELVRDCPSPHAERLAELGLSTRPVCDALAKPDGRHELDAALAHFEGTLVNDSAFAFR